MATISQAKIELVPWDHNSEDHVERMRQQRIHCGWMSEMADLWKEATVRGIKTMYWVVRHLLLSE